MHALAVVPIRNRDTSARCYALQVSRRGNFFTEGLMWRVPDDEPALRVLFCLAHPVRGGWGIVGECRTGILQTG